MTVRFLLILPVLCWALPVAAQTSVVHACVNTATGTVRIVAAGARCRAFETALTWGAPPAAAVGVEAVSTLQPSLGRVLSVTTTTTPQSTVVLLRHGYVVTVASDGAFVLLPDGLLVWSGPGCTGSASLQNVRQRPTRPGEPVFYPTPTIFASAATQTLLTPMGFSTPSLVAAWEANGQCVTAPVAVFLQAWPLVRVDPAVLEWTLTPDPFGIGPIAIVETP